MAKSELEQIAALARELIAEEQAPPTGDVDPGFVSSFWVYPVADAHVYVKYSFYLFVDVHIGSPVIWVGIT